VHLAYRRGEWHNSLKIQAETLLRQSARDAVYPLHFPMALRHDFIIGLVNLNVVAPLFFGENTGRVGGTHDSGQIAAAGGDGDDPETYANFKRLFFPDEAEVSNGMAQFLYHLASVIYRTILQDEAKLISSKTAQNVCIPYMGTEESGKLLEEFVTCGMAAGIIDDLKLIEIQIAQDMLTLLPFCTLKSLYQTFFKRMTVDQTGEGIMCRLVRYLSGHIDHVCHVAAYQDGANNGTITRRLPCVAIAHWRGGEGNGTLLAIPLYAQTIVGRLHPVAFLQTTSHRICQRGVRHGLNKRKNVWKW
jgi:hypothetical protein